MGSVKIALNCDEINWKQVNLSNIENIYGLIKNRCVYKDNIIYKNNGASMLKENNYELLTLYIWLDDMIRKCEFNNTQKRYLRKMYLEGWIEEDIVEEYKRDIDFVKRTIRSICKKIFKQVNLSYKLDYLYWDKVRVNKWKRCSKCSKDYPATEQFFDKNKDGQFGLLSICKNCR